MKPQKELEIHTNVSNVKSQGSLLSPQMGNVTNVPSFANDVKSAPTTTVSSPLPTNSTVPVKQQTNAMNLSGMRSNQLQPQTLTQKQPPERLSKPQPKTIGNTVSGGINQPSTQTTGFSRPPTLGNQLQQQRSLNQMTNNTLQQRTNFPQHPNNNIKSYSADPWNDDNEIDDSDFWSVKPILSAKDKPKTTNILDEIPVPHHSTIATAYSEDLDKRDGYKHYKSYSSYNPMYEFGALYGDCDDSDTSYKEKDNNSKRDSDEDISWLPNLRPDRIEVPTSVAQNMKKEIELLEKPLVIPEQLPLGAPIPQHKGGDTPSPPPDFSYLNEHGPKVPPPSGRMDTVSSYSGYGGPGGMGGYGGSSYGGGMSGGASYGGGYSGSGSGGYGTSGYGGYGSNYGSPRSPGSSNNYGGGYGGPSGSSYGNYGGW